MTEHQLNDPDIDAVREQAAGALVPEVVPAEIDLPEPFAIPRGPSPRRSRLDAVGEQSQRFPGGLELRLVLARCRPEHVRVRTERRATFEDCGEPSFWIERNPPVLLVLGGRARGCLSVSLQAGAAHAVRQALQPELCS